MTFRRSANPWPNDLSILSHADVPNLTLITCQGYNEADNSYRYRIAVRAVLVSIGMEDASTLPYPSGSK